MDDCLTKPFEPADLYRMIERWTIGRPNNASAQARQPAISEAVEEPAALDLKAIQALKHAPGANGSGLLDKVARLFLETVPKDLADLALAIEGNAPDRIAGIAHKLKSASRNIGATELAQAFNGLKTMHRQTALATPRQVCDTSISSSSARSSPSNAK